MGRRKGERWNMPISKLDSSLSLSQLEGRRRTGLGRRGSRRTIRTRADAFEIALTLPVAKTRVWHEADGIKDPTKTVPR